ncbi:MAG: hypothetical protein GWN30_09395 [Gammaproteobacteria bacterium]|nr:hypothetical protein [Gammaproteobacteria bacterium]
MNYKNVMALNALMAFIYGFGSLLIPLQFWGLFGMDVSGEGIWGLRDIGLLVISNMYIVWSSRGLTDQSGRRLVANFVVMVWALFGVISLWGQFSGDFNALNWANVVGSAFFAIITFMVRSE